MSDTPSDSGTGNMTVPGANSSPAPVPAAAPPSAPPAPAGDDLLGDLPADRAVFDRGYVEKVRGEAQRYRTEARTAADQLQSYESVFGVYDQADRDVWFDLAKTWASDPAKAAAVMQQIASGVLGEQAPATEPAQQNVTPEEYADDSLTPDKVKAIVEESLKARDASAAEQKAINDVFAEVRAAGYDPETAKGFAILYNANHFTGGDIAKAIEMVKADDQKLIDDYVAGRTKSFAMPAPTGGVAGTATAGPITNIEDARKATDRFLQERRAAQ